MYKHARIAIDIFKLNSIFTLSHRRQTLNSRVRDSADVGVQPLRVIPPVARHENQNAFNGHGFTLDRVSWRHLLAAMSVIRVKQKRYRERRDVAKPAHGKLGQHGDYKKDTSQLVWKRVKLRPSFDYEPSPTTSRLGGLPAKYYHRVLGMPPATHWSGDVQCDST